MKIAKADLDSKFKRKFKKALVTGGAGFIGSHICEKLVKLELDVVSVDNYVTGKRENLAHLKKFDNFQEVECDICDRASSEKHFKDVDIVFHEAVSTMHASRKDPRRNLEVNIGGTLNLLELSRDTGVKKFVYASTGSVYGEQVEFPQTENHPLSPTSAYGVSKLAGENYVSLFEKLFDLDTTSIRYYNVYGPRQEHGKYGGVVAIFIWNVLNNKPITIFGDGTQERSFTYVDDIVRANLLVAVDAKARGEVYNCASGLKITINELADELLEYFGKDKSFIRHEDWLPGDVKKFDVDNSKIRSLGLDFSMDFKKDLIKTIESLKQKGR